MKDEKMSCINEEIQQFYVNFKRALLKHIQDSFSELFK